MSQHGDDQSLAQTLKSWEGTLRRLDAELHDLDERRELLQAQRAGAAQTIADLKRIGASLGAGVADPGRRTHFDRIVAYFRSVGNEPQTLTQLSIGARIPRSTVST